jgi:hypothetical protein
MREAGHQGPGIQVVHPFFEQADRQHLAIHTHEFSGVDAGN